MKFDFSKHALEQMDLRQIGKAVVRKILNDPGQVLEENGKRIYQSIVTTRGKEYLIRIFVNYHKDPNLVITVYKTSKISKYYEGEI